MEEEKNKTKKSKKKKIRTASATGKDFPISTKHSIAICSFIRNKESKEAIADLERVMRRKIAVPMKGEIPHRKNMPKGKPSGRYPIKASKYFIKLLKNLIANASIKNLNTDGLVISKAIANKGSKAIKGSRIAYGRKKHKRTNIFLEALEIEEKPEEKKKQQKEKKTEEKIEEKKGEIKKEGIKEEVKKKEGEIKK